jgi:hypothetical protein
MPKVGTKEYGYGERGRREAEEESERTGKPVVSKYGGGGSVKAGPKKPSKKKKKKRRKYPLEMDVGLPAVGDVSIGAGPTDDFRGAEFGITKRFKQGGVVYSDARGAGAATRGTRYRS